MQLIELVLRFGRRRPAIRILASRTRPVLLARRRREAHITALLLWRRLLRRRLLLLQRLRRLRRAVLLTTSTSTAALLLHACSALGLVHLVALRLDGVLIGRWALTGVAKELGSKHRFRARRRRRPLQRLTPRVRWLLIIIRVDGLRPRPALLLLARRLRPVQQIACVHSERARLDEEARLLIAKEARLRALLAHFSQILRLLEELLALLVELGLGGLLVKVFGVLVRSAATHFFVRLMGPTRKEYSVARGPNWCCAKALGGVLPARPRRCGV